jgi:hypothetical protein
MSDIFISYKREEQDKARQLANALEKMGWSVWWDPKLRAGEYFDDVIEKALQEARCVIVLWSELSVQSRYVKDEASYALSSAKLVPVAIEGVELPFRFKGVHTPQLIDWDGSEQFPAFQNLIDDISAILGQPATVAKPKQQPSGGPSEEERIPSVADVPEQKAVGQPQGPGSSRWIAVATVGVITSAILGIVFLNAPLQRSDLPSLEYHPGTTSKTGPLSEARPRQENRELGQVSGSQVRPYDPPAMPNGLDFEVEDAEGAPVAIKLTWKEGSNSNNPAVKYGVYRFPYDDEHPPKPTSETSLLFYRDPQLQWCDKVRYAVRAFGGFGGESDLAHLAKPVTVYQRLDPPRVKSCERRDGFYEVVFFPIPDRQHCSFDAYRIERCNDLSAIAPDSCDPDRWEELKCSRQSNPAGAGCTPEAEQGVLYRASVLNRDGRPSKTTFFRLDGDGCT